MVIQKSLSICNFTRGQFLSLGRVDNCDFNLKKLGTTVAGIRGVDDQKTLRDVGFVIGDYLDIAVSPPPSGGLVGGGPRGERTLSL